MESTEILQNAAAAALKSVSRNQAYKKHVLQDPVLHAVLLRGVSRYIGGESRAECMKLAQEIHGQNLRTNVDYMGESITEAASIEKMVIEFELLIDAVAAAPQGRAISLDLSHIGLAVNQELALHNAMRLLKRAKASGVEVMLNMEESSRTDAILDVHGRLCEQFDNAGITLQAYLFRTEKDLQVALKRPGRIRLVKGAYQEPESIARPLGPQVDRAYIELAKVVLERNHPCYIATHDEEILQQVHEHVQRSPGPPQDLEFEMNYGIRPDRAAAMRDLGYAVRIYLPYGTEWFLYLCHRIAEYPPNLYQAIIDIIEGA